MQILFNSGVIGYVNILFFSTVLFAFLTALAGFTCFIFFILSLLGIYFIVFLFRKEDRVIASGEILSPSDGYVKSIEENIKIPKFIEEENENLFHSIKIFSNLLQVYFKFSPCDGKIEDIKIFLPGTIKNFYDFPINKYRSYVIIKIKTKNNSFIYFLFEILFIDKNYDLYYIYVKKNEEIKKGDLLICIHFHSFLYMFIPNDKKILIKKKSSLLYSETIIV